MRLIRRLFPWTLRLAALAAVGVFVFVLVRYRPRCTIRGDLNVRAVSADGALILTYRKANPKARVRSVLQVWDSHRGKIVHYLLETAVSLQLGLDGRHGVGILPDGAVRLFDWQAGAEWPIPGVDAESIGQAHFSPGGRWLAIVRPFDTRIVNIARPTVIQHLDGALTRFSPDDRFAFTDRWRDPGPQVYHLDPFEPTAMGRTFYWHGFVADMSADGALLALKTDHWEAAGVNTWKRTPLTQVWKLHLVRPARPDVRDARLREILEEPYLAERFTLEHFAHLKVGHEGAEHRRRFSPCSRYFAAWLPDYPGQSPLEIVETQNGRRVATFEMKYARHAGFSSDGSVFWLLRGEHSRLTALDVATGKVLWETPCSEVLCFCPATGVIVHRTSEAEPPALLDVSTGLRRGALPQDFTVTGDFRTATPGGSRLALAGAMIRTRPPEKWETWLEPWLPEVFAAQRPGVLIVDTATGESVFRIPCRDFDQVLIADDGRTLITVHRDQSSGQTAVRVWDVEPRRAWIWTTAIVVGVGVVWSVARCWRRHRALLHQAGATGQQVAERWSRLVRHRRGQDGRSARPGRTV
jgi:hypothetical protein